MLWQDLYVMQGKEIINSFGWCHYYFMIVTD